MSDEDLNINPLFSAFLASAHYKQAAKQQLIIVVPNIAACAAIKINQDNIDNHILKQSPYYQDEYVSVNGKGVAYNASQLVCKAANGWKEDRIVAIIGQELYYDDEFESFSVLRVALPLEGKVSEEYLRSLEAGSEQSRPERRSIAQHEQLLVQLTGDSITDPSSIFASIHKFVVQFNTSYVLVKGFIEHAGQKAKDACLRLFDEALNKAKSSNRDLLTSRSSLRNEMYWAIESIIMNHIHKKLFTGLCELYRAEEEALQCSIGPLRLVSQESLGIRDEIVCHPNVAIALLADLGSFHTPLRKLAQLENVGRALTQAVRQQSAQRTNAKDIVLSAEDVIPLTLYALVHSGLPHVYAHLQYLNHFAPSRSTGSLDHLFVHFANFHAAVQLIQSDSLSQPAGQTEEATNHDRTRSSKRSLHQRSLSSSFSNPSFVATNNTSASLNPKPAVARIPSRSPTRSFSVIHHDDMASGRSRRPSVARIVSTPLSSTHIHSNGNGQPRAMRSKPSDVLSARSSLQRPVSNANEPDNASNSVEQESQRLGEFLWNLKRHSNVVVGTLNDQKNKSVTSVNT